MSRGFQVKRRDRVAGCLAAAALVLSGVVPVLWGASAAGAATSVTPGSVTLDDQTAGKPTTYHIGFHTSPSGSLGALSSITFAGPTGTAFPSCSSLCSNYSVTSGSSSATVGGATVNGSSVKINLTLASIPASSAVTVTITGVTNPIHSGSYTIGESTSADTTAVPSSGYSVVPGVVASVTPVSGDGQTTKVGTAFAHPLVVVLEDKYGNTEPAGIQVAFAAPACGTSACASATFASNGTSTENVSTAADGTATSGALSANATPGSYAVTASLNGLNASFNLRNVFPVTPGTVSVAFPQAGATTAYTVPFTTSAAGACSPTCSITLVAPSGTVFPSTLASYGVAVSNQHSATVSSVSAPAGAHTVFIALSTSSIAAGDSVTVTITGVGNPTKAANDYSLQESTSSDAAPAASPSYAITAGTPTQIQPVIGNGQSTQVLNAFPSQLIALVTDTYGNPVPGARVAFTAPATMNGAAFGTCDAGNPYAAECLSDTDGSGYAYAPTLIAGSSAGEFSVVATSGQAKSASFAVTVLQSGYWMAASDGGIFSFGGAPYSGSMGGHPLNKPIVGMAAGAHGGYYMVASDGGIFSFGNAPFYGSRGGQPLNKPIVGMAVDPATGGYWLVASDGGVFSYNAPFLGSMGGHPLNKPIVGMAATADGSGYYLVASDGGIFSFGNAPFLGSMGGHPLNAPVVGMAVVPAGGYYLVASDGGIFNYGPGTVFLGSAAGLAPYGSVIGIAIDPATDGYWIADNAGRVYTFGTQFYGSMQGKVLNKPVVAIAASAGF